MSIYHKYTVTYSYDFDYYCLMAHLSSAIDKQNNSDGYNHDMTLHRVKQQGSDVARYLGIKAMLGNMQKLELESKATIMSWLQLHFDPSFLCFLRIVNNSIDFEATAEEQANYLEQLKKQAICITEKYSCSLVYVLQYRDNSLYAIMRK